MEQKWKLEAIAIVQVRGNGGLDYGGVRQGEQIQEIVAK